MILYTKIGVPMTNFTVDVMVGGSEDEHRLVQANRYGFTGDDLEDINNNECIAMTTSSSAIKSNEKTFLLHLDKMPIDDIPVFIHELWHLMWHISRTITDYKLNPSTEIWAARMIEDLSRQILNAKYEELNLEYGE